MGVAIAGVLANLPSAGRQRVSIFVIFTWSAVVFICGFAVRMVLFELAPHEDFMNVEPVQVALALLRTGTFSDAYGPGAGPTAHTPPLHPILLSFLFRLFGTGSWGLLAMGVAASAASACAFALLPFVSVISELGLGVGVGAGFAGALLPFAFWTQTSGTFDAPFTAAALMLLFIGLSAIWKRRRFSGSEALWFGIGTGISFLLNPVLIAVVAGWAVAWLVRSKGHFRRVAQFLLSSFGAIVLVLSPWAIRNHYTLGKAIWTRSNFGLELQLSNNDVLGASLDRNTTSPYFKRVHPLHGDAQRARVRRLGEVEYMRQKKEEAFEWIRAHRRRFLVLCAERFELFWFPRLKRPWQSAGEDVLTVLALVGAVLLFRRNDSFTWIAGTALITYPAVYYIIQVGARYRFPLEPILFLLAAIAFAQLARRFRLLAGSEVYNERND